MFALHITLVLSLVASSKAYEEPKCSRFEYDLKTLEKMVKVEHKLDLFEEKLRHWERRIDANIDRFDERDAERNEKVTRLQDAMENKVATMEAMLEGAQSGITDEMRGYVNATLTQMNATMEEFRVQQTAPSNNKSPQVAFTAHGTTGKQVNSVLTFNRVILNAGDAYDKTTGRFKCPVAGTYLFTATLLSIQTRSSPTYCYIRKNAAKVALVYSHTGTYDSASTSILFHLSVGDFVDLGGCTNPSFIITASGHTLFIGSLIQAD